MSFKQKLEFWETGICYKELDSSPIINDFSDEMGGEINECNVSVLYNKMCQHLEKLYNSLNQHFPNHQCMMLQNYTWAKHPFKMYDRTMDFNITEHKKNYYCGFRFHFITNLQETTNDQVYFFKREFPSLPERAINISCLFYLHICMSPAGFSLSPSTQTIY